MPWLISQYESCYLVTAPRRSRDAENPLSKVDLERSGFFFPRIESLLLTIGIIMGPWTSVPYIWRGKWRDYMVAEKGYICIYATAGYPEFFFVAF